MSRVFIRKTLRRGQLVDGFCFVRLQLARSRRLSLEDGFHDFSQFVVEISQVMRVPKLGQLLNAIGWR